MGNFNGQQQQNYEGAERAPRRPEKFESPDSRSKTSRRQSSPLERNNIWTGRYLLLGRNLRCGHRNSLRIPIQTAQDEIRYKDMAPKYQLGNRRDLPRHPKK